MFVSNILNVVVLLSLQAYDGEKKTIVLTPLQNDTYFSCATKLWFLKNVKVMWDNKEASPQWGLNFWFLKKDSTKTDEIVSIDKSNMVNFPICIFNYGTVIEKVEILHGATVQPESSLKRVRREFDMKQSWNSKEFYQVIKDDSGMEITVRINKNNTTKNNEDTPKPYYRPTPLPKKSYFDTTTTTTSTSTTTTSTAPHKIPLPLTDECKEYKFLVDRMIDWGLDEIYKLTHFPTASDTCRRKLPHKVPDTVSTYSFCGFLV